MYASAINYFIMRNATEVRHIDLIIVARSFGGRIYFIHFLWDKPQAPSKIICSNLFHNKIMSSFSNNSIKFKNSWVLRFYEMTRILSRKYVQFFKEKSVHLVSTRLIRPQIQNDTEKFCHRFYWNYIVLMKWMRIIDFNQILSLFFLSKHHIKSNFQ